MIIAILALVALIFILVLGLYFFVDYQITRIIKMISAQLDQIRMLIKKADIVLDKHNEMMKAINNKL